MNELEILQGNITAVIFQNHDNGYTVLRMECDNGQTVTVVGTIPLPFIGERLMVTGKWSSHPSYGIQFEAEFLERLLPQTSTQILTYLSGRAIKGIGPKLASAIVNRFGEETLLIMEREPERLAEVSGISDTKALAIGEAYRMQVGIRHILEFFALHSLPSELAIKCYKLYFIIIRNFFCRTNLLAVLLSVSHRKSCNVFVSVFFYRHGKTGCTVYSAAEQYKCSHNIFSPPEL
jgi:exodeoxyribonuclease V alpha subunit